MPVWLLSVTSTEGGCPACADSGVNGVTACVSTSAGLNSATSMTDRVDTAYQRLDVAVKELVAALEESSGTEEAWVVSHYLTVVGQQRFGDFGVESAAQLLLPFGGQMTYPLKGLMAEVPGLVEQSETVEVDECD